MKLNTDKTNYMIFSRSETEFATRLQLKGQTLDRKEDAKLVRVWISTWLDWKKNTREKSCNIDKLQTRLLGHVALCGMLSERTYRLIGHVNL